VKIAILSPVAWRTPPRHYGPWEQVASNVAEGLIKKGWEVTLFATGDSSTAGHLASVVPRGYEEDPTADAKVAECLHISHLMERASEFDLIHNHFDFLPLTYTPLIRTPMVTTIHGFSSSKIIPVYERFNAINHYVSISDADRSPSLRYIATVYNGLRVEDFTFTARPDPSDYLLFLGRIHPDKGTWEAIEIARKAGKRLLIAGIVQDRAYYQEKVAPYLDKVHVEYIGPAGPRLRDELLGRALGVLHPIGFAEPFGMSVAEAMMCGTPVVAFNRGSMPELIRDGETGFLVESVDEAADKVNELAQLDRSFCRAWAIERFSQERMVADYIKVYHQILSIAHG
jgi:glycosyltransferase involved in cell wall biosynthesis